MNIDISERKKAVDKLAELNRTLEEQVAERTKIAENRAAALRKLAAELTRTEYRERKRLAHLLHDDLQQQLVGIRLMISGLIRADAEKLKSQVEKVDERLKESLSLSRNLTKELSPPILRQGSLKETILWLAAYFHDMNELQVDVEIEKDLPPVPEHIHLFFFYAIKELILNAFKHSGQNRVLVRMQYDDEYIIVQVEDHGTSFDPKQIERDLQEPETFGLFQIRERLEALGGDLHLENTESGGGCVRLLVPLSF